MIRSELLHSRIVRGLRLILPLAALAVLSTLFLFSRDIDPSRALPLAAVDAEDLARDPRITAPRISTVTLDGTALTLVAETLRIASADAETAAAEGVTLTLDAADGRGARITADHGAVDRTAGQVTLKGDMLAETDDGYHLRSDLIVAALDTTRVESPGRVTGFGPLGEMEAGGFVMEATQRDGSGGLDRRLLFSGGVRLIYRPQPGE
jgi:lipopolysaccharide export system protein LptC